MTLHHPTAVQTPVLDNAPVEMRLPVLSRSVFRRNMAEPSVTRKVESREIRFKLSWSSLQPILAPAPIAASNN